MNTRHQEEKSSSPRGRRWSPPWWVGAAALATCGVLLLLPRAVSEPSGGAQTSETSPSRAAFGPAATATQAPSFDPPPVPVPSTGPAAPSTPAAPADRDERAAPMSDTQLQDLVDDSYPDQIRGAMRQVLTDIAWATQIQANNGWIPDPQLQAVAVLPGSQEPLQAAVVVLMWSGTDPVLGPRDRRLTRVAVTLIDGTWVGKIASP